MFMTEASSTEVRLVFHWDSDDPANGGRRQKRHLEYSSELDGTNIRERADDEVLEGFAVLEIDVGTSGEVRGLLKEDGIRTEDFAYIYGDFLRVKVGNMRDSRKESGSRASGRKKWSS